MTLFNSTAPKTVGLWSSILTHTHMLRTGRSGNIDVPTRLVEWCREFDIAGVGLGSPWDTVSGKNYGLHETVKRDAYYAGLIDPKSVMDCEVIQALFDQLNRQSGEDTLFYIDNESPKCRYGHLWYFGYNYDFPAWHDYSQDRPIQYYRDDPETEINPLTGKPHRRRPYLEIVATQRKAGALAVWAHPTSWWLGAEDRFITNIAAECVLHLLADGHLDGLVIQGYDACHRQYQNLWFHLLDTGAIIPGFAESDMCMDGGSMPLQHKIFRTHIQADRPLTTETIVAEARAGKAFVSNGAFMTIELDGQPMGSTVESTHERTHHLRLEAYPVPGQNSFSRIDLIGKGGRILESIHGFTGGVIERDLPGSEDAGYIVARGFGEEDDPEAERHTDIRYFAMTNPIYLHPAGFKVVPATTACTLTVPEDHPYCGGTLHFEEADGREISRQELIPGTIAVTLPASARVRLTRDGLEPEMFYIAMENVQVQALLRYLTHGEFRQDYPGLEPGEVPVEAFRLDEMRQALQTFSFTL